jgi:hypothetical protein
MAKSQYVCIDNIGDAKSQFFKQKVMVDFAGNWLEKTRK